MTDTARDTFGDFSSNNTEPNLGAYAKAGHRHLVLKATEGTDYTWADGNTLTQVAHGHGLHVGRYHVLASHQDVAAQARYFIDAIRPTLGRAPTPGVWPWDGDWLMADVESLDDTPPATDANRALQVQTFTRLVTTELADYPLVLYLPDWYLASRPQLQRVAKAWLVLASNYDNIDVLPNPYGLTFAGWQYSDKVRLAGEPAPMDANRFLPLGPSQTYLGNPNWRQRVMLKIARTVVTNAVRALVYGGDHGYFNGKRFDWVHPANDGMLDRLRRLEQAQPPKP